MDYASSHLLEILRKQVKEEVKAEVLVSYVQLEQDISKEKQELNQNMSAWKADKAI
jgi:hypothetical protein